MTVFEQKYILSLVFIKLTRYQCMSHTAFVNIEYIEDSPVRLHRKWSKLPCSESYSVETKCIEVNFCPFSCNQAYFENKSESSIIFCQHSCRIYVLCVHFLSDKKEVLKHLTKNGFTSFISKSSPHD